MKKFFNDYIKYLKYIRPFIKYEAMILTLVFLSSVVSLANPILLKVIIDRVLILKEVFLLKYVIIALVIFFIVNIMILYSNGFFGAYIGQMVSIKLRKDLFVHIQKLKLSQLIESSIGDFISKITEDITVITDFLSITFVATVNNIINVMASAALMLYFSPKLSLIALFVTGIELFISIKFSKIVRQNQSEIRQTSSRHISFLKQIFSGIKFMKAFRVEKYNERKYFGLLKDIQQLRFKNFYIHYGYDTLLSCTSFIGSVLIFTIGVNEIIHGNMTVGALFVFDTVSERFYQFSNNLVNLNINLQGVIVSFDRINSIFGLKTEDFRPHDRLLQDNSVRFENVDFKYNEDSQAGVLQNINFTFHSGETYALVGSSGSGKSTILNLILHFYEIQSGKIYIGNKEINEIDLKFLRQKVSLVFQEAMLNEGTIETNIRFGNETASFDDIVKVSKICCLHDFILTLPDQYATRIDEEGEKLSSGQKQRICIARSILRNSDIYIFDEALSNLDKKLEFEVFENLQNELKNKTQIYITHNIMLIKKLKNIVVVNKGEIEAVGDHAHLIQNSATYREFYEKGENNAEELEYA